MIELKMNQDDIYYFKKAMDKLVKLENILGQYPNWVLDTIIGYEGNAWIATLLEQEGFYQINIESGEPLNKEEFYANFYDLYSNKSLDHQYEDYLHRYEDMIDFIINYRIEKEKMFEIQPIAYMGMNNWSSLYIYDVHGDYIAVGYSLENSELVPINYLNNCSFIFNGSKFYLDEFLKVY